MTSEHFKRASDPGQYDNKELIWSNEGNKDHFTRRMLLEAINPYIGEVAGLRTLDVGCGQGWLSEVLTQRKALTTGIDPSEKNIIAAREQHPGLSYVRSTLKDFKPSVQFSLIAAVMSFEHFGDLGGSLSKLKSLMTDDGCLLVVSGDHERFTAPRFGYDLDIQHITEGESAVRTDYGERMGVVYDILRTPKRFQDAAKHVGLYTFAQAGVPVPQWLVEEQPRYEVFAGQPMFQLYDFRKEA